MKLTVKENSTNYACSVVEIKELFPIEGADAIVRVVVNGNNVVVPKTTEVGSKMLYFVSGTKLSEEYCKANNLYERAEENLDPTKKGFISFKQKRVKAIKLRGVISDGMLMPLNSLDVFDLGLKNNLFVGNEFTDIDGVSICEKYVIPVRNSGNGNPKQKQPSKVSRLVDNQFYLHVDTSNLRKNMHQINPDDIIGIHYKKHGTSVVVGNVLVKRVLKWYEKVAKFFGAQILETAYDIVYSSRKVIKNGYLNTNPNSFYSTDIWGDIAKEIGDKIPKNYTVYGEILGFTSDGGWIQKDFDYGCNVGEHKFYIYRMTVVNSDGNVLELTDKQIEEFCEKNGFLYKDTFIYYGAAKGWLSLQYPNGREQEGNWEDLFLSKLEEKFNEKDCYMCTNKVPEEGIIVRKESSEHYEAYKLKSKRFLLKESEEQEKEVLNLEDNQTEE